MASSRDILEARRYNQRRLVTVFTSGTAGGHEYESRTPTGPVIVSLALCVVLMIAGIVAGKFAPKLPADWGNKYVFVTKETGERYYTLDGVLRPLTNITSARLLNGAAVSPVIMPWSQLENKPRGSAVGLVGVPDNVPDSSHLQLYDWTACVDSSGTTNTWIGEIPQDRTEAEMALVRNNKTLYLIDGSVRHRIVSPANTSLLIPLDLSQAPVTDVAGDWINLFSDGSPIQPLVLSHAGQPASELPATWGKNVIGQEVDVGSEDKYVIVSNNTVAALDPLADKLYQLGSGAKVTNSPIKASLTEISMVTIAKPGSVVPADWPATITGTLDSSAQPCAYISTAPSANPSTDQTSLVVHFGSIPAQDFAQDGDGRTIHIAGGSGALIQVSGGGDIGAIRLITDTGVAFSLGDNPLDTLKRFLYQSTDIVNTPQAWATLVPTSPVELSFANVMSTVKDQ